MSTLVSHLDSGGSPNPSGISNPIPVMLSQTAGQTSLPTETTPFANVMNAPQKTFRCGFENAVASGLDPLFFTAIGATGSGMGASQAAGSALLTTGTTAYSESIWRSLATYSGSLTLAFSTILSQRIANQSFFVELVDLVGDGLAFTCNSAISITVVIPGTTLTSSNVGQSIWIGALSLASCPGGKYAIASVSGTSVTFTVAGFPVSGSGTCSLFGRNFHHIMYDSTVATAFNYDAGRGGYSSGESALANNTTASPGHTAIIAARDAKASILDQLSATSTTLETALRGQRSRNIPEDQTNLYIQIRMINGASAPATTTTWTLGFVELDNFISQQVQITGVAPIGLNAALPVQLTGTSNIAALQAGQTAHSSPSTGAPVRVGGRVSTAVDTTLVAGDASDLFLTSGGAVVQKPYGIPELDWLYAAATGGISNTTTAVTVKAAGAAGVRNYITNLQLQADALGSATEFCIRDGAAGTVLYRHKIGTAGIVNGINIDFTTPLRGTAATLVEVVTLTASITGGVFPNLQGYQAP